jgi:uncharacterized protein (DUF305 family)
LKSEDSIRAADNLRFPIVNVNEVTITNDPDIDFARHMKLYYSAGLKSAEIEMRNGKNEEIKEIAKEQFTHHNRDIEMFDDYVHNQEPKLSVPRFIEKFYAQLKTSNQEPRASKNFDEQYLALLIKHHQEAILLCELYITYGTDPFLKIKAKHIVADHKPEIKTLQQLLLKLAS